MKKTSKFFIVIGCMFAVGVILSFVGVALGGTLTEASIIHDKFESKNIQRTMENTADIRNLSFDISACDVTLKNGEAFSIEGKGISRCEVKNGTWYVSSKRKKGFHLLENLFHPQNIFTNTTERKVTITIPNTQVLHKISLDASAIDCKIERLACRELDLDVAAGSIKIVELSSDETDISVNAGDIKINTFQIRGEADISCSMGDIKLGSQETRANNLCHKLEAECSMGDVKYYGKLTGENDVEVTMGSIKLDLSGTADQYDFSSDITLGSVRNEETEVFSRQPAPFLGKGDLSCTMGDISVSYHEE